MAEIAAKATPIKADREVDMRRKTSEECVAEILKGYKERDAKEAAEKAKAEAAQTVKNKEEAEAAERARA